VIPLNVSNLFSFKNNINHPTLNLDNHLWLLNTVTFNMSLAKYWPVIHLHTIATKVIWCTDVEFMTNFMIDPNEFSYTVNMLLVVQNYNSAEYKFYIPSEDINN
jgi:hypothetical protein